MSDTTNPNIFPLDEFDPDKRQKKGKIGKQSPLLNQQPDNGQEPDDPVLFPLDEFQITQPAPPPPPPKKTSGRKRSAAAATGSIKKSKPNPPIPPVNPGPGPQPQPYAQPSGKNGCGGCLVWILLLIGLIYFRDNIRQTKIYNDHFKPVVGKYLDGIEEWVKEKNPVGSKNAEFEKLRKQQPSINLDLLNSELFTVNRKDTFSTSMVILTGKTGNFRNRHLVSKATKKIKFKQNIKNKILQKDTPVRLIQDIDSLLAENRSLKQKILAQEWSGGPLFYLPLNSLVYFREVELNCIPDEYDAFINKQEGTIFIPEFIYDHLLEGMAVYSFDLSSIPVQKYTAEEAALPVSSNLFELAEKQFNDKTYETAKLTYDNILKESPFNQEALLGRANTYLMLNKFDLALKDYNIIISLSAQKLNDKQSNQVITEAVIYRGVTEYFRGNYDRALNDLDRILNKGVVNQDAYLFRGLCKKQLEIGDNGCSDFARALELGRKDAAEFICRD